MREVIGIVIHRTKGKRKQARVRILTEDRSGISTLINSPLDTTRDLFKQGSRLIIFSIRKVDASKSKNNRTLGKMTTLRSFRATDLLRFNTVNLDHLTETYHMPFYQQYLATWPDLFITAQAASGTIAGYMMGKVEGEGKNWHGHVTAVTVAPMYRRLGLAKQLMVALEEITDYK